MMASELDDLDLTGLVQGLQTRQLRPMQVVEHYLAVAHRAKPLHAFVELFEDEALDAARQLERQWNSGACDRALAGVPMGVKNNIDVRGKLTAVGASNPPWGPARASAACVSTLQAAGAIVMGTTQCVEMALGGWGSNEKLGTPRNPWSPREFRVTGGSSSGSAVAVAAGAVPFALGTDTGGSIRTPAAWCGITGLKTSRASLPLDGVVPLSPSLDTVGLLCRSARDSRLLFDAMTGVMASCTLRDTGESQDRRVGSAPWHLARLGDSVLEKVDVEIRQAYERVLEEFTQMGATIVGPVNCELELAVAHSDAILLYEAYANWKHLVEDRTYSMDANVRRRILAGRNISLARYQEALQNRSACMNRFEQAFSHIDALVLPTVTMLAPQLHEIEEHASPAYFSRYANFLDLPALALPVGQSTGGLPISVQLVGRKGGERHILDIGCAYQANTGWHLLRPPPSFL